MRDGRGRHAISISFVLPALLGEMNPLCTVLQNQERRIETMTSTQAACCLIPKKSHSGGVTNLGVSLSETVKCDHCYAEYRVDYQSGEIERIKNYREKLLATARTAVNDDHIKNAELLAHSPILSIWGVD